MLKIQEMGLVATPKSQDDINAWIERHTPEDRLHLYTAAYMMWNFLAAKVNAYEEKQEPVRQQAVKAMRKAFSELDWNVEDTNEAKKGLKEAIEACCEAGWCDEGE